MVEREMDDLAMLWMEAAAPEEEERLVQELARGVGWRGQLMQYADYGAAVAIAGAIALLTLIEGTGSTAVSGLMIVLVFAWLTSKRQALWEVERSLDGADREVLLANAARITQTRLKRTNLSLAAIVPSVLLTIWFGYGLVDPEADTLSEVVARGIERAEWNLLIFGFVGVLIGYLVYSRTVLRRQLRNIEQLGLAYHLENRLDRGF